MGTLDLSAYDGNPNVKVRFRFESNSTVTDDGRYIDDVRIVGLADTTPPTSPANLVQTGSTATSISLAWEASTDNQSVVAYDIYRDNVLAGSTTSTSITVNNLSPSTSYNFHVLRPEPTVRYDGYCCIELTGASPVAVSAEAPHSRPRAWEEIPPSEWGVKSPQRVMRCAGGEQVRRPSIKRTLQPREIRIRKEMGRPSRSCHGEGNRLHQ